MTAKSFAFTVRKAAVTCPLYSELLPDSEALSWEWVLLAVVPGLVWETVIRGES
jgi:hypothetical protein